MYYLTKHCTPSSSTSLFMVFHAVCLDQYQFHSKINKRIVASTCNANLRVNTSASIHYIVATYAVFSSFKCKACVQRQRTFRLFCM